MLRISLAFILLCGLATHQPFFTQADAPGGNRDADTGGLAGVRTDLIFDNIEPNAGLNPNGASPACQYDASFPLEAGAADDFVLPASPLCTWTVTSVRWSGIYWGSDATPAITQFRIVFWPDVNGAPAGEGGGKPDSSHALAVYDIPGSANEMPNSLGLPNVFDYSAVLPEPFEARPGIRYWLQIQPSMAFPPQWGWHVTVGRQGAGPVKYFDLLSLPAWTSISDSGDLAFQLLGEPQDVDCDDGDACTEDACIDGVCVSTPVACDDNSACTEDSCDPAGGCVFTEITCDDGSACTTDGCDPASGCVYQPITCNDDNACTTDTCDPADGCSFTEITCDDGSACTTDSCDPSTGCVFSPVICDDDNECTDDTCDPSTGCVYTPIVCDDQDACTTDSCDPVSGCVSTPITCDDDNECTDDTCDPSTGCVYTPIVCDDQDACTTDSCDPVNGCVSTPITCDDDNGCTEDTCDPASGCTFTEITCDDGDACTDDSCDPPTGCVYTPIVCDDQDPCTIDTCVDGECTYSTPPDFDGDRDVDHVDFTVLSDCMSDPISGTLEPPCDCADLNGDGRVDLLDYAWFQNAFTGGR